MRSSDPELESVVVMLLCCGLEDTSSLSGLIGFTTVAVRKLLNFNQCKAKRQNLSTKKTTMLTKIVNNRELIWRHAWGFHLTADQEWRKTRRK